MTATSIDCRDDARRAAVRAASLNGLDYVEVSEDQRTLTVYFLGKAPVDIDESNVRIEGGRRVRDVRVLDVTVHREPRRGRDDWMDVLVDRPGDFSTYTLRLVDSGRGNRPLDGFDPRYAALEFSFKAGCASELDCVIEPACTPATRAGPDINYLARDYAGFRQVLLDRLAILLPDWRERHVPDLGITLVELLAYTGDYLSQYQDAVATEAYLATARLRISVRRHLRLIDYRLFEGSNARAWISLEIDRDALDVPLDLDRIAFATRYAGAPTDRARLDWETLSHLPERAVELFEPLWPAPGTPYVVRGWHSRIEIYTWGDAECCLPEGATEATLLDAWLPDESRAAEGDEGHPLAAVAPRSAHGGARRLDALSVGDVLLLEEVLGPTTGNPADADPTHRHAVRLVEVRRDVDALYRVRERPPNGTPVVHVRWRAEDALPFALCVSTRKPAPDCGPLTGVSVVRGNVVLVDHGHTVYEPLPPTPGEEPVELCDPCDDVAPAKTYPFEPVLERGPLTFSAPFDASGSARGMTRAADGRSMPQLSLAPFEMQPDGTVVEDEAARWTPRDDLIGLGPTDRGFVAEMDDDGFAHVRFARDVALRPARSLRLRARYRVGMGPSGNVGPESIAFIVANDTIASGVTLTVRNPLPAAGGLAPESLLEARLMAPNAFRARRERAVIAADYAELLERDLTSDVQGAAAALRWNGSWFEARIGVDARGSDAASSALLRRARERLHRYRRVGHDLQVASAVLVPLAVTLGVCVAPGELRAAVTTELLERLGSRRKLGGGNGFFHPDNLRFGGGISVSDLVAVAAGVPGVASAAVTRLERLGEGPNQEIERGILSLGAMEIAQLDNDPSFPERGVLKLDVRGGR